MRKILTAVAAVATLMASGLAGADPTHGHCTAYFNGSENGRENKRQSTAFQEFASYVGNNDGVDNDGDDEVDEGDEVASELDIFNFCSDPENNPKGIGGNPDDPNTPGDDGNGNGGKGRG